MVPTGCLAVASATVPDLKPCISKGPAQSSIENDEPMIVSHCHRFIFIKTVKTAGTSIEVALSKLCGEQDVVTPIQPPEPSHRPRNYTACGFYNHMSASEIRRRVGETIWSEYLKVTVERNPWDKIVSWYYWQKHQSSITKGFDEFIELCRAQNVTSHTFPPASELYTIDGRPVVDCFIRYEYLLNDVNTFLERVAGQRITTLPRVKADIRGPHRVPYAAYYTDATRTIIADRYKFEIGLLGYAF